MNPDDVGETDEPTPDDVAPKRPGPDKEKVKAAYRRDKERGEAIAQKYRGIARVNESFYAGDHWSVVVREKGRVSVNKDAWFDTDNVPRIAVNRYTGLHQTWSSLLTRDQPTVKARPASDEPEDTYRAAIGQQVVEFLQNELGSSKKINRVVQTSGLGGTAGIKCIYDSATDAIAWTTVSVHDFILDPAATDEETARFFIFEDHVSPEEAEEMLAEAGLDPDQLVDKAQDTYTNSANEELIGVAVHEYWKKPTRDLPRGAYACFVGTELVECVDYPYVVEEDGKNPKYLSPLVLMRVREQRGSAYGLTNFTDAVPLQRAYNENVSRAQKVIRTSNSHLLIPQELAEGFDPASSSLIKFPFAKAAAARTIGWTQPARIDESVFAMRDFFAAAMEDVVGLNAVVAGTATRSLSGRAIDNMVQLNADKNSDAIESMRDMVKRLWRLSLALVQRYYTAPRIARISGGDAISVMSFIGSDIAGVDIELEDASEIDTLETRKEEIAAERMQQGVAGPLDLAQAQRSPSLQTGRAAIAQMFESFRVGLPLAEVPDDVDPAALEAFAQQMKARAIAAHDQDLWVQIERFKKQMKDLISQQPDARPVDAQPMQ